MGGPVHLQVGQPGLAVASTRDHVASRHGKAPHPGQEFSAALDPEVLPIDVLLGRLDLQVGKAQGVGTLRVEDPLGCHQVSAGLGHLGAAKADHALGKQTLERFPEAGRGNPQVGQGFGEEAGIHEMEDGVFDSTDVLVNGQPPFDRLPVERRLVAPRISEPQEVPGRVHEGVHGVGLPASRPSALRAGGVEEALMGGKRGPPCWHELDVVGQVDR